jgi:DNA-binding beta-propeller fold protein YncE
MRMTAITLAFLAASGCKTTEFDDGPHWPGPVNPPGIGAGKVIITNNGDDTVSWIDLAGVTDINNTEVVYVQPVGLLAPEREGPHHGAAMTDGSAFFVGLSNYVPGSGSGPHGSHGTGSVDGYLLKYDPVTLALVDTARVSRSPGDVRLTPDGTKVLQTHYDLVKVTEWAEAGGPVENSYAPLAIVDEVTMEVNFVPACPAPHGVMSSADSKKAFISCSASDELAVASLEAPFEMKRFAIGAMANDPSLPPVFEPYAVVVHPTEGTAWVSNLKTGDIRIFDPVTETWDARGPINVGGLPFFSVFNADGSLLFVPVQAGNSFVVIDGATGEVKTTLMMATEACYQPHAVILTPDEKRALVVCEGDHTAAGTVAVINLLNPLTPVLEKFYTVGVFPDDAFIVPGAN